MFKRILWVLFVFPVIILSLFEWIFTGSETLLVERFEKWVDRK